MESNYEEIVRTWYNRLRPAFIHRLLKDYPHLRLCEVENLYQDTFLAVHRNLTKGRIKEATSWYSYIMTIGVRLAAKEIRKCDKTDSIDDFTSDEEHKNNASGKVQKVLSTLYEDETPLYKDPEAQAVLGTELEHTPEPCSSIIRMFYYRKMNLNEIAEQTGYKNNATVKSKKSQCMKNLMHRVKSMLRKKGFEC